MIYRVKLEVGYREAWFDFPAVVDALEFMHAAKLNRVQRDPEERYSVSLIMLDESETGEGVEA